jgi:phosphate-selective porin OprO/OprP
LDHNDDNIERGRLHDWTAGLNWYLNGFAKLQFNYIHPMLDSPVNGDSTADIFATRAQFDF